MAYQKGLGYVGYGVVTQIAQPIHVFRVADGRTLAEVLKLSDHNAQRAEGDWEYAVGVDWKVHFPLSEAKTFRGVFANQNIVCKLSDPETIRFLEEKFGLERPSSKNLP